MTIRPGRHRGRSPHLVAFVATVAMMGVVAAGCGVTSDPQAKEIPVGQLPFGLADTTTSSTTPPPPPTSTTTSTVPPTTEVPTTSAPSFAQTVYLAAAGGRIRAVTRTVAERPSAASAVALLTQGAASTDPAELSTFVTAGVVEQVVPAGGVAVVSIGATYAALDPISQLLATAQLVLALTELPGIGRVTFTAGGAPIPMWLVDGSQTDQSTAADDYRTLVDP